MYESDLEFLIPAKIESFAHAMFWICNETALMGHFKTDHSCVVNMAKGDVILKPRSDKKENCTHLR